MSIHPYCRASTLFITWLQIQTCPTVLEAIKNPFVLLTYCVYQKEKGKKQYDPTLVSYRAGVTPLSGEPVLLPIFILTKQSDGDLHPIFKNDDRFQLLLTASQSTSIPYFFRKGHFFE